jgi:phospholipid/cholesterol/gamma-HCH transport system substrate-binding protein
MSEKAHQFRIGLFVLVGVAIVLGALFLFGIRSAFQPTYKFETYTLGDVEGLSVGSAVKLRGVEIGKVIEIGFSWNIYSGAEPRCIVVRCAVGQHIAPVQEKDFKTEVEMAVAKGLRAVVQSEGITGGSVVALQLMDGEKYPPLNVPWKPKYWYVPSAPSQLGRLLAAVDRTLANLEKFDAGGLSDKLGRAIESADLTLRRLNDLDVKRISGNANQVLADAGAAVVEIKALVQDARKDLDAMKLDAVGENADRLIRNLDQRLAAAIERLSAIDVRSLNDTLAGTKEAARSLTEALEELKRYPAGFLFGGPPPPASVLEKEKK